MVVLENLPVILTTILIILLCIIINKVRRHAQYWTNRGIPTYPNYIPIMGNFLDVFRIKISAAEFFKKCYESTDDKVLGIFIFHKPALIIRCPDLITQMFARDFDDFSNHYMTTNEISDPVGTRNIFVRKNPFWKIIRTKLTPIFTPAKLKNMFGLMKEISDELKQHLTNVVNNSQAENIIEIKELSAKYTTDILTSCVHGLKSNCLLDPGAEFRKMGKTVFGYNVLRRFEFYFIYFLPQLIKYTRCKFFGKESTNFLREAIGSSIAQREKSGIKRNDLIDILVKLKNTPHDEAEIEFDDDTLVSQAAVLFTAGFDTSSNTITFALYEMAKNTEIQDRLRKEIKAMLAENNGDVTYEAVMEMRYMNMVISETLRKYPPVTFMERQYSNSEKSYELPEPHEGVCLESGTPVYVSILGLHMDAKHFPDPERFDPERFTEEEIHARNPNCYIPYSLGPRYCIGERFAQLLMKLGLTYILKDYEINLCAETPKQINIDPFCILFASVEKIPLQIKKIE